MGRSHSTEGGQQAAYVHVRARTRFMVYGNQPAKFQEADVWILAIPVEWAAAEEPGSCSRSLSQRCGTAVSAEYAKQRQQAFDAARKAAASGGDFDAGHYVMEGASIWLVTDKELVRRPWAGHHRFFHRLDDSGLRKAEEADRPKLAPLSAFEEHAYAGWRNEQTNNWAGALKAHEAAFALADEAELWLLGEVAAGRVRANGKMKRFDAARATAVEGVAALEARGATPDDIVLVWIRLGENLIETEPREAGEAVEKALALLPDDDARVPSLALSAGLSALRLGEFALARPRFERAVAAMDQNTMVPPRSLASALNNLALTLEHAGELEKAEAHIRRAVELHRKAGNHAGVADSNLSLARILARTGHVDASALLAQARRQVRSGGPADGLAHWAEALLLRATGGDPAQIDRLFDRAAQLLATQAAWLTWMNADR